MGKVLLDMTMSLDGFIADRNGSVQSLYPDLSELGKTKTLQELIRTTGAVVMGRHAYDMAGDYTGYEYQGPIFVVTRHVPEKVAKGENERLKFTFVTDGVKSAIEKAKAAAGDEDVTVIGGADVARQCIRAGLLDEIQIHLMPLLLGEGLRLFDDLGAEQIDLERIKVLESTTTTDIRFRVVKE